MLFTTLPCAVMMKENVIKFLGINGILSEKLEGFEHRPQQVQMAQAVEKLLAKRSTLLLKQERGRGKVLLTLSRRFFGQ